MDESPSIATESMAADKVCKERIDAFENARQEARSGLQASAHGFSHCPLVQHNMHLAEGPDGGAYPPRTNRRMPVIKNLTNLVTHVTAADTLPAQPVIALTPWNWSRTAAAGIAIFCSLLLGAERAHGQQPPSGKRSPLTSIGAVEDIDSPPDLDDPGTGGGFDAENYFQNILVGKVSGCIAGVQKAFLSWSQAQSLTVSKTVQQPTSLLAYTSLTTPPGVLQLTYRFSSTQKRARATLYFYSTDGTQHEPAAIEALLKQYKVATLQDELRRAIACQQT